MNKILASFARNTVFANIAMFIFFLAGGMAVFVMIKEEFPEFSLDAISITVAYPGADPEEVEEGICQKLEEAVEGIEGIKQYTTTASENMGFGWIEVKENYDVGEVLDKVRNAVNAISTFPVNAEKPIISEFVLRNLVAAIYLAGDMAEAEIRQEIEAVLKRTSSGFLKTIGLWTPGQEDLPVAAFDGVDTVFHLAGKAHALSESASEEASYFQVNREGTRRVLEAAHRAGVRRFVFFSSVKAMGEGGPEELDETCALPPETPYGRSKRDAEELVLEGNYVPEPVVLRLTMVYGPGGKGNLERMIGAVARRRFPPLPEFGNSRSMVHVDDVIQAATLAAGSPRAAGRNYILTDGRAYSTRQIYEWICEALGRPVPRWRVPGEFLRAVALGGDIIGRVTGRRFFLDTDSLRKLSDSALYSSARIEKELGFSPRWDLRSALPEMVAAARGRAQ